jgi:hypothetical protein
MLKVGALVKYTVVEGEDDVGIVIDTYPPTVYDNRLYSIQWQHRGTITLEEEKSLQTTDNGK